MNRIYTANITAGSLLVPESRKIADLMLRNVSADEWKQAIEEENILQKLSLSSSKRIANLIKARLELMAPEMWEMVRDGGAQTATHAVFSSTIKHSHMLGDYLDMVVREQFQHLEDHLTQRMWDDFITDCRQRDPLMTDFSMQTANKMRSIIHNMLFEAGYIKNLRSLELQKVTIDSDVINYLKNNNEQYVLKCIQVC